MEVLDISDFMEDGRVKEASFFERIDTFDWPIYKDKVVLIRGCETAIIPPWALMVVAARLAGVARRIQYGNEHSSVKVFRRPAEGASAE